MTSFIIDSTRLCCKLTFVAKRCFQNNHIFLLFKNFFAPFVDTSFVFWSIKHLFIVKSTSTGFLCILFVILSCLIFMGMLNCPHSYNVIKQHLKECDYSLCCLQNKHIKLVDIIRNIKKSRLICEFFERFSL